MNTFWLVLGFFAQDLFAERFLIQWIASERAGARGVLVFQHWWCCVATGICHISEKPGFYTGAMHRLFYLFPKSVFNPKR